MKRILRRLEQFWCITMHTGLMWPYKGHYRCRTCLREYPVPFEALPENKLRLLPAR